MDKLKPCGQCGGDAELIEQVFHYGDSAIRCTECGAEVIRSNVMEVVKAWNLLYKNIQRLNKKIDKCLG